MIEIKKWLKQIITYFKPIKGFGTIGMYQRTIVYSLWVLGICIVLSIFLEFIKGNNTFLGFVETYAIGIACSDVVVIVTSITQFKSERNKKAFDFYLWLFKIVAYLNDYLKLEANERVDTNPKYRKIIEQINREFNEFSNHAVMLWFDNNIMDKYLKIIKQLWDIRFSYDKLFQKSQKTSTECLIDQKDIRTLTQEAYSFFNLIKVIEKDLNIFSAFLKDEDKPITDNNKAKVNRNH